MWLKIKCKNYSEYVIGVIYRHPNHIDINDFNLQLNEILQQVSSSEHKCIVLCDFNIDLLNKQKSHTSSYLNMINSNAFHSIVNLTTRVTPKSSTFLDHVLTNDTSSEIIPGILRWDINNHFPTLVQIKNLKKSTQASFYRSRANFDTQKFLSHLQSDLQMIKCNLQVLNHINFNATFECFLQIFKNVVNLHTPEKKTIMQTTSLHQKP